MDRFATLTKACGGALTIESLTEFQQAMREYEVFMRGMGELLAPIDEPMSREEQYADYESLMEGDR